jgi:PTS system glucose-specific IIA component
MRFIEGLFDMVAKREEKESSVVSDTAPDCVYSPAAGEVILLKELKDGVFSEGVLGKGCGLIPAEESIYAPFDGQIVSIAETRHAIGLRSDSGIELLIHVGMDTVEMKGKGFAQTVKAGDRVKCGQRIMSFSIADIKSAGHDATISIVVTNCDDYEDEKLLAIGLVKRAEQILKVI